MDKVYIIKQNDGFLVDVAYSHFPMAVYSCKTLTGFECKEPDVMYEISPMNYIKIISMDLC